MFVHNIHTSTCVSSTSNFLDYVQLEIGKLSLILKQWILFFLTPEFWSKYQCYIIPVLKENFQTFPHLSWNYVLVVERVQGKIGEYRMCVYVLVCIILWVYSTDLTREVVRKIILGEGSRGEACFTRYSEWTSTKIFIKASCKEDGRRCR